MCQSTGASRRTLGALARSGLEGRRRGLDRHSDGMPRLRRLLGFIYRRARAPGRLRREFAWGKARPPSERGSQSLLRWERRRAEVLLGDCMGRARAFIITEARKRIR